MVSPCRHKFRMELCTLRCPYFCCFCGTYIIDDMYEYACMCVCVLVRLFLCTHTLAQNYPCGFWCGMHLTCKNTPIIPDRNGSMKGPEKFKKLPSPWAIAITRCKELEADPSLSTKPNRSHLDRLRKPCKNAWRKNKLFENGMAVLRLATSHDQKVKFRRYVGMISPNILPTHE